MKRNGRIKIKMMLLFMTHAFLFLYSVSAWAAGEAKQAALNSSDCYKCHQTQPAAVEAQGGKHKTITCQDCHSGHRPVSKNNIPQCSQCHQGKPHYNLKGCLNCHTDPHKPLGITFPAPLTDACLTCHTAQIKQLRENRSKHTAQFCTTCHGVHRKKPACTQCHKPHSSDMTAADCSKCHKAHMPRVVRYSDEIESKYCASCHKPAFNLLNASTTLHNALNCAFCHKEKHRNVPKCKDCHGDKHPESIMAKFPRCGDCHKIAHDLNNWRPASAPKTVAPKAIKKIN